MPDPQKLLATIRRAAELFRSTPGRRGAVGHIDDAEDVWVVGDLHGNIPAFAAALRAADLAKYPGRHLVLQELVHDTRADPDAGVPDLSHRLVDVVAALKCQYPERVHLILGNHELSELTGRPISKNGFALNRLFHEGLAADHGEAAPAILEAYHELFRSLPLACRTPNRVFIVHTLPDARDLDRFDPAILDGAEWTDEATARGGTVYALTWGRDDRPGTVDRFAGLVDADLFVTGHQPCDEGFRRANDRQVIVDATPPYPALVQFPARGPITIDALLAGVRHIQPRG